MDDELLIINFGDIVLLYYIFLPSLVSFGYLMHTFCPNQLARLVKRQQKQLLLFRHRFFVYLEGKTICLPRTMENKFASLISRSSLPDGRTKERSDCENHTCWVGMLGQHNRVYKKKKRCKVYRQNVQFPPTPSNHYAGELIFSYIIYIHPNGNLTYLSSLVNQ